MKYVTVAKLADLPVGARKTVSAEGTMILLVNVGGKVLAIADTCPHLGGSLSKGVIEGGSVACPNHHARFDLATGKNLGNAKILFLNMKVKDAKAYEVRLEGGEVSVGLD